MATVNLFQFTLLLVGIAIVDVDSSSGNVVSAQAASWPYYELLPGFGQYKIHISLKQWDAAQRSCEAEGAHLAIPDSEPELDAIKDMVARTELVISNPEFWTGVRRNDTSQPWTTVLGQALNNADIQDWALDALEIETSDCWRLSEYVNGFELNTYPCRSKLQYLCEKN